MPDEPENWTSTGQAAATALAETWGSLAQACHALVSQEWALETECPGWDVKDVLSHLIGIERIIMGEAPPAWEGPGGAHVKNDVGAMNEAWVEVRRPLDGQAVLAEFNEVTARRLAMLDVLDEEGWAKVGWSPIGNVPHARFMETRVFDSWIHEQDARFALDRAGGTGNHASHHGIGQVQAAMGMIVGKRVKPPEGTVVRFELNGDPGDARQFALAIQDGRATPVDASTDPTVSISTSCLDFVRLGAGRATAEKIHAAGGIQVEGDAALGQKILENMNFMF